MAGRRRRYRRRANADSGLGSQGNGVNGGQNGGNQSNQQGSNNGDIVLGVYLHCEECAKKIVARLIHFDGVEDVKADCKQHKVTVKGKNANPKKVAARVKGECNSKQVILISPKLVSTNANTATPATNNNQPREVIVVVKMYIHCENCAKDIKKSIHKMEGVKTVKIDMTNSQITVKGNIEAEKLVKYIDKKMGKLAAIMKTQSQNQEPSRQSTADDNLAASVAQGLFYSPAEYADLIRASEMFSDENALACTIM